MKSKKINISLNSLQVSALACYALTEPNAGSDAMNGESTAYLNEEKTHYILKWSKNIS